MVVSMDATFNADHVFAALADATRRDIVLRALSGREGVAELAGHYPMSFAAVQKHVAVLERAGPGHQGAHRPPQGRPHQHRGASPGARPARPVRGAVARPHRPHDRPHQQHRGRPTHDRHRRPQGSGGPDHDPDRRVRRLAGARLGPVGRSAQARALVGSAHLPRHLHDPRPGARQPRRVPHDRAERRPAARLLGHRRGRSAAPARLPRRVRATTTARRTTTSRATRAA